MRFLRNQSATILGSVHVRRMKAPHRPARSRDDPMDFIQLNKFVIFHFSVVRLKLNYVLQLHSQQERTMQTHVA